MRRGLFLGGILVLAAIVSFLATTKFYHVKRGRLYPACQCSQSRFLNRYLKLSDQQRGKIDKLEASFYGKRKNTCRQLCDRRTELSELFLQPDMNRQDIDSKIDEINALQGKLEKEIVTHILEIKASLTPEQQNKFVSIIAEELCRADQEKR